MRTVWTALILVAVGDSNAAAQTHKAAERPPDLALTAIGRQHHAIATKTQQAQDYFDQGVTLIYGFNHEEAECAFGLMHSLRAQQKVADAAWVEKQFDAAWKNADTELQVSGL